MTRVVKVGLFLAFLVLFYSICWYVLVISLCLEINKNSAKQIKLDLSDLEVNFSFQKVTPYGFPFKIGCKTQGLQEETDSYIIIHKGLIVFGYDLLKKGLFFGNQGESIARVKPEVSGFGSKVISNNSYFLKLPFSKKLLANIKSGSKGFEIFNFIKNIEIQARNVQVHDLVDNALIFDHELTNAKLSWENNYYYRSFDDLINHIPPKYNLALDVVIKNVVNNKKLIAPFSLIYGFLPNSKFNLNTIAELNTNSEKAEIVSIIKNSTLNVSSLNYNTPIADADFKGQISIQSLEGRENGIFDFTFRSSFDGGELMQLYSQKIKPYLFYRKFIVPSDSEQEKIINKRYVMNLEVDGNYILSKKLKNFNFETFNFMLDDVGVNLHIQSSFSSLLDWYVDGNLMMFNYPVIAARIADVIRGYGKHETAKVDNIESELKSLFKIISNHPESNSNDLSIDLKLSHNLNNSKIGLVPLGLFLENYTKILNRNNN